MFSHPVGCIFIWMTVSFILQKLFWFHEVPFVNCCCTQWLCYECSVQKVFYFCQWVQVYSPFSLLAGSVCLILSWSVSFLWSWVLCSVICVNLFVFWNVLNLNHNICWRFILISSVFFWIIFQNSGVHGCMDLSLGL